MCRQWIARASTSTSTSSAAAAILGMIPIMHDVFWGPMAYAIAGGLAGATLLTLLFLPALYVVWFRVKPPPRDHVPQHLAAANAHATGATPTAREGAAY